MKQNPANDTSIVYPSNTSVKINICAKLLFGVSESVISVSRESLLTAKKV